MKRVLQIVGSLNFGGIEAVIMNLYRKIDRNKYQFDFVTTDCGERFKSEINMLGGRVFQLPSKSKHPLKYMTQLKTLIKSNKYEIVHSNTNSASAFLDLYPAKKANCNIRIAHSHNSNCLIKWQHYLFKPLLRLVATYKLACSDSAAKWMYGNKAEYHILHNGIDFDKFAFCPDLRNAVRDEFSWGGDFVIGNVASFQERKNQKFLIKLMPDLIGKLPNIKLVFVGQGATFAELSEMTKQLNLENYVEFLGNRNDVSRILNGFDVFCFPSVFEGLSVAYLEAAANGLDVLISDSIPYTNLTPKIHRLSLSSPQDWISTLIKLNEYRKRDYLLSDTEKHESGYDINICAQELESIYDKLLSKLK